MRTVDSAQLVQRIDLPKARFICLGEAIYVASPTNCWRLEPVEMAIQIKDLMASGEFEEALNLAKLIKESPEQRDERMFMIKQKQAFSQFSKRHFEAAMKTFSELDIEPTQVTHRGRCAEICAPASSIGSLVCLPGCLVALTWRQVVDSDV